MVPARYAMAIAIAQGFNAGSLRILADAVFEPGEVEALTRFMSEERGLLAAVGLDSHSLGDRRIESICVAADLAFGLGRFVRLATAARAKEMPAAATGMPPAGASTATTDALFTYLQKALHALAEQPEQ